jgi:hypothetical protein
MSVVLPVPDEPIIRMFPVASPARCLARAIDISRIAASCPITRERKAPAISAGVGFFVEEEGVGVVTGAAVSEDIAAL